MAKYFIPVYIFRILMVLISVLQSYSIVRAYILCKPVQVKLPITMPCKSMILSNCLKPTIVIIRSPVPKLNFPKESSATKRFDLKESLKKPLSYKPHRGKLRGFDQTYIHKEKHAEQRKIGVKSIARSKIDKM